MNIQQFRWDKFKDRWKTTHCSKGHAYVRENVFIDRIGSRQCLTCKRQMQVKQRRVGCIVRLTD